MNPPRGRTLEHLLVDELRLCAGSTTPTMRALRAALDCSAGELAEAVQRLRYRGKVEWDRLVLSPSMLVDDRTAGAPPAADGPESGAADAPSLAISGPDDRRAQSGRGPDEHDDDYPSEVNDELGEAKDELTPRALYDRLMAEGAKRGLNQSGVSRAVFGNEMQMSNMKRRSGELRPGTVAKALAWLAGETKVGTSDETLQGAERRGTLPAESEARDVPDQLRPDEPEISVRRVEEPRSDPARDQPAGDFDGGPIHANRGSPLDGGPIHANRGPPGAPLKHRPAHESEVARAIREEVAEAVGRRRTAQSSGSVQQPLEVRKFGVPDLSFGEGVASLLVERPNDLMAAISRKHTELWRRVILLGRSTGQRPAEALYAALEVGLASLEGGTAAAERSEAA